MNQDLLVCRLTHRDGANAGDGDLLVLKPAPHAGGLLLVNLEAVLVVANVLCPSAVSGGGLLCRSLGLSGCFGSGFWRAIRHVHNHLLLHAREELRLLILDDLVHHRGGQVHGTIRGHRRLRVPFEHVVVERRVNVRKHVDAHGSLSGGTLLHVPLDLLLIHKAHTGVAHILGAQPLKRTCGRSLGGWLGNGLRLPAQSARKPRGRTRCRRPLCCRLLRSRAGRLLCRLLRTNKVVQLLAGVAQLFARPLHVVVVGLGLPALTRTVEQFLEAAL